MDAALLFRDGNALHAVDTRFIAERALGEGEDVDLPAAPLAEACVHAEQVGREQRSFVTAGPGADLDDGVAIVERIAWGEQLGELRLEPVDLGPEPLDVGARQLRQLRVLVGEHLARLGQLALEPLQAIVGPANCLELRAFATELLQFGWIPRRGGVGQLPGDLLRPRERLAESGLHGISSLRPWFRTSGGTAPRGRPYRAASACP